MDGGNNMITKYKIFESGEWTDDRIKKSISEKEELFGILKEYIEFKTNQKNVYVYDYYFKDDVFFIHYYCVSQYMYTVKDYNELTCRARTSSTPPSCR